MTSEEIRTRSLYLFLACSQAIEQCQKTLLRTVPALSAPLKPVFEKTVKKELGLVFRYWATQRVWQALEAREVDAKNFNLSLLRLFFDGLRLPKDGSGLRYAELLTVPEQVSELYRRLVSGIGMTQEALLKELQQEMPGWHTMVMRHTADALGLPLETLANKIRAWAERAPDPSTATEAHG